MKKFPPVCLLLLVCTLVKSEPNGFTSLSDSIWQTPAQSQVQLKKNNKADKFSTSFLKKSNTVFVDNKSIVLDPLTYCNPAINQADPCNYGWISNVTLGNTLNKSSACSGGYDDYSATDMLITAAGETINFSVSDGSTTGWSQYVFIFIDYNADGDFDDIGEKVADGYYMDPFGFNATGSFVIPSLLAGGDYRIRVICDAYSSISGACNTDLGEAEDYTLRIPLPVYCAPVISQPCDMWISNVTIGSINNNSVQPNVCTAGGYSDYYPSLTATAGPGQTVNFSMSGTGNNFTNQFADVYIDYNGDGDFDDAGENVSGFVFLGYSGEIVTGSFVIPQNQPYGFYRMRFKSYNMFELQPGPCGNSVNGETEDYRLLITCVSNGSQISVKGNNIVIPDGTNAPNLGDFSDFGNVPYGTSFNRTFVIENNGSGPLNLSGVTIDGPDAPFFSVLIQPDAVVAPGNNTSFTVQFSPASLFNYYAALHINSDNCNFTDYNFSVQGTGSCSLDAAEINVQGNNIDIAAFDFLPSIDDNTDFGTVISNAVVNKTFVIQNTGSQELDITAPIQLITYDGPLQFAVTNPPASTIPAGSSTSFTISFLASGEGFKYAYVRISSNDCDESSYDFLVGGTVECLLLQPEINIKGNGQGIADGNTITSISDNTDFGVAALNTSVSRTFVIENNGTDPLNITGISFSGTNATAFTVTGLPLPTVAAGSSTNFIIQFNPLVTGVETAVVYIHNTDCDEGDYDFTIRGTDGTPCTPATDQPCSYVSISNVSIGTINNPSSCSGGYADYSASVSTTVQGGIPVNFSIDNGGFVGASISIYADFNTDGDFDDVNEQLAAQVYAEAGMAATGSFIVSPAQPLGNYRLRIVSEYFGYGFTLPCYTYNGEIEDYTLTIGACIPNGSDIVLQGNNTVIPDGNVNPALNNFTDFGPVAFNSTVTRTYIINNPGTNTLHISAINFSGINASAFTVVTQPASTVAAGNSTSFTVQFAPVTPGPHVAVVHVMNDNCARSDYDFVIHGESIEFTTLNIKMFIQGYYQNFGSATPMDNFGSGGCLFVIGGASNQGDVDNVTVSLMDASTGALVGTASGLLQTNGSLSLTLPASLLGNSYYLKLNHRNSVETWSANPVMIHPVTNYDFSSSAGKAYQGNQVEVEPGVFAIYSGDIIDATTNTEGIQDGVIESADYSKMENDVYMVISGYVPSDITGDGVVESADYSIMENNVYMTISVKKPF